MFGGGGNKGLLEAKFNRSGISFVSLLPAFDDPLRPSIISFFCDSDDWVNQSGDFFFSSRYIFFSRYFRCSRSIGRRFRVNDLSANVSTC